MYTAALQKPVGEAGEFFSMREVMTLKDMNFGKMMGASSFRCRLISNYTPIIPNVITEGLQMMLHTNYHLLDQPDELQLLHFLHSRRAFRVKGAAVADHDVRDERSFILRPKERIRGLGEVGGGDVRGVGDVGVFGRLVDRE
jgi:hypothetical protein